MKNTDALFKTIDKLLKAEDKNTIFIAIDGRCGSGKSTLADELAKHYDCNLFHMDDFFLPFEMRSSDRLSEPGGNVHYERFLEEVITPVLNRQTVMYQSYSCATGSLKPIQRIEPKKLNIVEGAYSLHPSLHKFYDLKVFLTHERAIQLERILKRNGPEKLQRFIDKWIPMEEKYFSTFGTEAICDLSIDTSDLW
ncbi:MAG: uridine kinase [Clostridia bacterium]|jgi:uridine kinase|nr:uridine kinase [Clostridia bacterium]